MHSRQYYEPVEFYRRAGSGLHLPLAHSSGPLDQYETSSQVSRRTTPSSESDRHGTVPRKRVPVACERCRKRKIKCSGDDGHGGCSNCRNAGLQGCQFLRVASLSLGPESMSHMAHLQATQQQHRSHPPHHRSYPFGHYSHSTVSHYHPYLRQSAYRHHNHGQQQYTPAQNGTAYASHPSTPCPPGLQADYSSYGEGGSGVSWTRATSFSGYGGYAQDEVSPAQYGSQQPASFLLPGGDPMASSGTSFGVSMYPGSRSNSQAHLWGDGMQSAPAASGSNYLNNVQDATVYETALAGPGTGAVPRQAMVPYQINTSTLGTSTNNDRVLPTPGSRHYSSGFSGSSTLDSLPLSALSHRSSIGWSTDSASSASHLSSQTSATGSSICHDFSAERSSIHRTSDSHDIPFNGLGFDYSPQQTNISSNALPTSDEAVSTNSAYLLSKGMASQAIDVVDLDPSSTQDLPAHHQRCRTVSQSSTPIVSQMSGSSTANSMPQLHRHHTGTIPSRSHEPNINDIPEPTAHLHASSAPSYSTVSSTSSLTTTYNPKPCTISTTTNPSSTSQSQTFTSSPSTTPFPNSSSATGPYPNAPPTVTNSGYTTPPVTQPQQRGGVAAAIPSSLSVSVNAGAAAQSQTRVGGAPASGSADAVSGGGHGGVGLSLLGYAGGGGARSVGGMGGMGNGRQGYVHVGVSRGVISGGGGVGVRGIGGSGNVSASAGAGADEYGGQMAGEVAAVAAGEGGSGRTSVSSMGYGLS